MSVCQTLVYENHAPTHGRLVVWNPDDLGDPLANAISQGQQVLHQNARLSASSHG
ncbi:MAG: hypothetical protein M1396_02185 [Chloroflexi bacterium]|nr:hypothetical protein [Chloroflexota bacterium]